MNGELIESSIIAIPEDYSAMGFNKNIKTSYGVSILLVPLTEEKKNKLGDLMQYDIDIKNNTIGNYINIYR